MADASSSFAGTTIGVSPSPAGPGPDAARIFKMDVVSILTSGFLYSFFISLFGI